MTKVLVSDKLAKQGLSVLEKADGVEVEYAPGLDEAALVGKVVGYDGLVIRSGSKVTSAVIDAADRLKVVGRAGIGVDNVDLKAAKSKGVVVMNTPTGNSVTTAEHALALMFALARNIPQACAAMKKGEWAKSKYGGVELWQKTIGVIGLGNIGGNVAKRAAGLEMKVIGFDPVATAQRAAELGVELVELPELFKRADVITVHAPLNDKTRGLVNDKTIGQMKPGVLLINAARGGIYDDEALLRGLEAGKIGGVAVDVYPTEPPGLTALIEHPKVIATPHLGASTTEAQVRVAVEIAHQVIDFLRDGTLTNAVVAP